MALQDLNTESDLDAVLRCDITRDVVAASLA
jgi:hypothetical protein